MMFMSSEGFSNIHEEFLTEISIKNDVISATFASPQGLLKVRRLQWLLSVGINFYAFSLLQWHLMARQRYWTWGLWCMVLEMPETRVERIFSFLTEKRRWKHEHVVSILLYVLLLCWRDVTDHALAQGRLWLVGNSSCLLSSQSIEDTPELVRVIQGPLVLHYCHLQ